MSGFGLACAWWICFSGCELVAEVVDFSCLGFDCLACCGFGVSGCLTGVGFDFLVLRCDAFRGCFSGWCGCVFGACCYFLLLVVV